MKKLESLSIPVLVSMFAIKWGLEIISEPVFSKLPTIWFDERDYRVFFKGALSPTTSEKLTKKILIHPEKNLRQYLMNQLLKSKEGVYSEIS